MWTISEYKRKAFLGDHPVITKRVILHSTGEEQSLIAGSVIGVATVDGKKQNLLFGNEDNMIPLGILQEDIVIPSEGDAWASIYVHCACLASGLVWADGISADDIDKATEDMRQIGIFVE